LDTLTAVESWVTRSERHKSARAYRDVAAWLDERELAGKATRTLDGDERYTAALLNAEPDLELDEFTRDHLVSFLTTVPPASRRKYASHLTTMFQWAVLNDRIARNPMDRVPRFEKPKQRIVTVFSDAEVEALCAVDVKYLLLFDTGVRSSEARALQVKHVLFEQNVLTVLRGKGSKDRLVPLTQRLAQALAEWFLLDGLNRDDFLWATRPGGHDLRRTVIAGPTSIKTWHRDRQEEAGVRYRNLHATRHTFATRCLRKGMSLLAVSRLLGHASIKTTSDEYAHLAVEDLAAELALLEA
jgi:integrase/recombinase XerD